MSNKKPELKCDVCGTTENVGFFGQTSVTVCDKPSCNESQNDSWEEHCREMDAQNKYDEEMGY